MCRLKTENNLNYIPITGRGSTKMKITSIWGYANKECRIPVPVPSKGWIRTGSRIFGRNQPLSNLK
jgi:hypothetical protein